MPRLAVTVLANTRAHLFAWCAAVLSLGAGCSDDDPSRGNACGGHGELHGDHCHCEPGFVLSDDQLSCVHAQDTAGDGHDHDAGNEPDVGADTGPQDEEELNFSSPNARAATGAAEDGGQVWLLEASGGDAVLTLELYEGFGGPTSPGVVAMTNAETNYATCGTCLILQTGCYAHDDHFHCERTFMPRAEGQVRFDVIGANAGDRLAGELQELVFQEVSIGADFQTAPVDDGAVLRLATWAFDVTLSTLGGSEGECGGHGHMHGNTCHCDPGYRLDPDNPALCIPA